jgi:hypothetical protein
MEAAANPATSIRASIADLQHYYHEGLEDAGASLLGDPLIFMYKAYTHAKELQCLMNALRKLGQAALHDSNLTFVGDTSRIQRNSASKKQVKNTKTWHKYFKNTIKLTSFSKKFLFVLVLLEVPSANATDCWCKGCGCKGGTGWRGPDNNCTPHKNFLKVCGDPPSTRCIFEGAKQVCESNRQRQPK